MNHSTSHSITINANCQRWTILHRYTMSEPTTSLKATVADESEEIAAEASTSTSIAIAKPENGAEENGDEVKEDKVDPNAVPEDACVTLYLQNLNEKVKIPGKSYRPYRPLPLQGLLLESQEWNMD